MRNTNRRRRLTLTSDWTPEDRDIFVGRFRFRLDPPCCTDTCDLYSSQDRRDADLMYKLSKRQLRERYMRQIGFRLPGPAAIAMEFSDTRKRL